LELNRNHGGDLSKVLAGIQVPPADQTKFDSFLEKLGYPFTDETENVCPFLICSLSLSLHFFMFSNLMM
jgi:hypothetical protein